MRNETLLMHTSDGLGLEADLLVPDGCTAAAFVAHPHPQYGGNRWSPVVTAVVDALAGAGFAALRFDFRGVGRSEGRHGGGVGERLDVAAALATLRREVPEVPVVAAGYSFGAKVALELADPAVAGWVAVAPPLDATAIPPAAARDPRPKLLLVPAHDQFCLPAAAAAAVEGWLETRIDTIEMADHFLSGRTAAVAAAVVAEVRRLAGR